MSTIFKLSDSFFNLGLWYGLDFSLNKSNFSYTEKAASSPFNMISAAFSNDTAP